MNKLSRNQLDRLAQQIQKTNPHQALQAELLDHIASLIEKRMDQGQTFAVASDQVMQQANPQAMAQLKQLYNQVGLSPATLSISRIRRRSKRRPATRPFRYMLLSSGLAFLTFMSFMIVVSRPLAIPIGAFQTVWGASLAGLISVLVVRWWLVRRLRRPKRLLTV